MDKTATYIVEASQIHERDENDPQSRGGRNSNWWFGPASRALRGRWHFGTVADKGLGEWSTGLSRVCREIPGECVYVDLAKKEWGIFDPMTETEDGQRRAEKIKAYYKANPLMGAEPSFKRRVSFPITSPDQIKDLLYWMRRGLDSKCCVVPPGAPKLPSMNEIIALPGKRVVSHGSMTTDKESREYLEQFAYAVPIPAGSGK